MRLVTAGVIASLVACSAGVAAQTGPRRDGNWEVTTQMMMNGKPVGPPRKEIRCVTKEDAADPTKAVPGPPQGRGTDSAQDCKITDQKVTGDKINWTVKCTGMMPLDMIGEIVYTANAYTGTMTTNMNMGGQVMATTSAISGKRLGDCVK